MADETKYVFVYQPPSGWDLSEESRDHIVSTGNILRIQRSSLNSLQWIEYKLDYITRRPLTAVLLNVWDRYDYRLGSDKNEPFEVIEAADLSEVASFCNHQRYKEWDDTITYQADPEAYDPQAHEERTVEVVKFQWTDLYTGRVVSEGHKPRDTTGV
jgi:hypothetical protein